MAKATVEIRDRKTGKKSPNFQSADDGTTWRTRNEGGGVLFPKTVNNNVKRAFKALDDKNAIDERSKYAK